MTFPGPDTLGRGVVLGPGDQLPPAFDAAPVVQVTAAALADPSSILDEMHRCWSARRPFVVRLAVSPDELLRPETSQEPPWSLGPDFEFTRERLAYLVWANNYDLRNGRPVWWHAVKARTLGVEPGGPADGVLPDGRPVWIDGGPRRTALPEGALVAHRETFESGRLPASPGAVTANTTADLAPDQLRAVEHPQGAARIIAPAGSGKTRVLTERLRHLVAAGIEPSLITAVAYNKRAADELLTRAGGLGVNIRTIHSLGLSIVNRREGCRVVEEHEVRRILEPLVPLRGRRNEDVMAPYLEGLQAIRIGLQDPAQVEEERDDTPGLAEVYTAYRQVLRKHGLIDFEEQVFRAIEILLADPEARARARASARHLLVDEFQDLTPAYLLLLRLLAAPGLQVFGVGDDDQVIYSYAGADPGYLIDFETLFPGAAEYALEVNYRCSPAVIDAANRLLSNSSRRIAKATRPAPDRERGENDLRVIAGSQPAKAALVALRAWRDRGVDPSAIAVLARVNDVLLPIHAALSAEQTPFHSTLSPDLIQRTGIRTALGYLRISLHPDSIARNDLFETLRRPTRKVSRAGTELLQHRSRWSLAQLEALTGTMTERDAQRFGDYLGDLRRLADRARHGDTETLLRTIRDDIGLGDTMALLDGSRSSADRSSHSDDLDALIEAAGLHPDLATFETWLKEILAAPQDPLGVTLSSVHRVKGREWPFVLVFKADDGLMPHRLSDDIEEERRVFHVAITRGMTEVVVVAGDRPSPFVAEMAGHRPAGPPAAGQPPRPAGAAPAGPRRTGPTAIRRPRATRSRGAREPAAAVGSQVEWRSYQGVVEAVDATGLTLRLDTGATLFVPKGETVRVIQPAPLSPDAEGLLETLRQWRRQTAEEEHVPAYVVFWDRHLLDIAQSRPGTMRQLAECDGVGPTKLDKYGEAVLRIIEEHGPAKD